MYPGKKPVQAKLGADWEKITLSSAYLKIVFLLVVVLVDVVAPILNCWLLPPALLRSLLCKHEVNQLIQKRVSLNNKVSESKLLFGVTALAYIFHCSVNRDSSVHKWAEIPAWLYY
jgi:hypothetical protein